MGLILKSFALSFGVFARMILPSLVILVVAGLVWTLVHALTGGVLKFASAPITATLMSLFGIRAALGMLGNSGRADMSMLAVCAVIYGLLLFALQAVALMVIDLGALSYALWQAGEAFSLENLARVASSISHAFALNAISAKALLSLTLYTSVAVLMAVPLAAAARAAGAGAGPSGLFYGAGRCFIPLFLIFALCFFLQFFFGLLTSLFAVVPLLLSLVSVVAFQTIPDLNADMVLKGLAASAGLLWLHAWIWAASALALVKSDTQISKPAPSAQSEAQTAPDMRAWRKARM